ncbi:hypothetical protein KC722_02990 [Candidatus Kaiserbacteria bacterium]|nr:hypothetical protein [Candidatus Kaiserbacteria bacterium]MCB9811358.1 hypothetical protein [Candidatus Nomurabacteria bacterium]
MAPTNNASFIPKGPSKGLGTKRVTRRIYVVSYIIYVLFFAALIAVVVVYGYSSLVKKKLDASIAELDVQRSQFAQDDLNKIRNTEKRLLVVSDLWKKTVAPSRLFAELENITSDRVTFTTFAYEYNDNDTFTYEVEGRAKSFNDIEYQTSVLPRSEILRSSKLTQYDYSVETKQEEGESSDTLGISFVLSGTLPVSTLPYEGLAETAALTNQVASEARPAQNDDTIDAAAETSENAVEEPTNQQEE